jgi:hypothetical protein
MKMFFSVYLRASVSFVLKYFTMPNQEQDNVRALVKTWRRRHEEVKQFVTSSHGYYAYLLNGERLDIVRAASFQPDIQNYDDYYGYLFIQTQFSFFIPRQRIIENKPLTWELHLEMTPHEPAAFFQQAYAQVKQLLALLDDEPPDDPENRDEPHDEPPAPINSEGNPSYSSPGANESSACNKESS